MTDSRDQQEPITGNDPTNGLAGDLEGDDGGAVQPTAHENVIQDVIADLDGDRLDDEGGGDDEDSATSYSEEGKP
jgi:hypothetical protein